MQAMATQNVIRQNIPTDMILHGDCISLMRQMPGESVDLIVTDPPYLVIATALDAPSRTMRTVTGSSLRCRKRAAY
jgi:DNA modification methylase